MALTTFSSGELNKSFSRAKRAADKGPVFITEDGRTAYVLVTVAEFRNLISGHMQMTEALAQYATPDGDPGYSRISPRMIGAIA